MLERLGLFGFSMATYNLLANFGLMLFSALLALVALRAILLGAMLGPFEHGIPVKIVFPALVQEVGGNDRPHPATDNRRTAP